MFRFKNKKKDKEDDSGALFIPAGLLTGMGIGFLTDYLLAGLFIGLGVGFAFFASYEAIKNLKKQK